MSAYQRCQTGFIFNPYTTERKPEMVIGETFLLNLDHHGRTVVIKLILPRSSGNVGGSLFG
jgi:hypothetical protein